MKKITRNIVKARKQLMLGEIISKLENIKNKNLSLFIDITKKRPIGINSWRGDYHHLAIQTSSFGLYNIEAEDEEETAKKNPTVDEWIKILNGAIGKAFTGYKGGSYVMNKNTPVWLAEYGDSGFVIDGRKINKKGYFDYTEVYFVDVVELNNKVYLKTFIIENQKNDC